MKEIVFIADFATKQKGDKWMCDSMLASQLVHEEKVAKYVEAKPEKKNGKD